MFKRLSYEEWQAMIPIIAFLITFAGFLIFTIRAVMMRRSNADRLAELPLEDALPSTASHTDADHVRH